MKYFFLTLLIILIASPAFSDEVVDFYFKNPSDLVWHDKDLKVGMKIYCDLSVHYRGKKSQNATVKIFVNGYVRKSILYKFGKSGKINMGFNFRVERAKKHYLEFVIKPEGDLFDKNKKNNQLSVSFDVPGPPPKMSKRRHAVKNVFKRKASLKETPVLKAIRNKDEIEIIQADTDSPINKGKREVVITPVKSEFKSSVEDRGEFVLEKPMPIPEDGEVDEGINAYPGLKKLYSSESKLYEEEQEIIPELSLFSEVDTNKPIIDVFLDSNTAFKLESSQIRADKMLSWYLEIQSEGRGQGEVEVVVADDNRVLFNQPLWIKAGKTILVPMKASFIRPGRHRLTAMVNTHQKVIDNNLSNNLVEQMIEVV